MKKNFSQKFSEKLKKVLLVAEKMSKDSKKSLGCEELLLSILSVKETLAEDILASFDLSTERLKIVSKLINHKDKSGGLKGIDRDARLVIKNSVVFASKYNHPIVDVEHLLLSLLSKKEFSSYQIIERVGIDPKKISTQIESIFSEISKATSGIFGIPNENKNDDDFAGNDFQGFPFDMPGQTLTKNKEKSLIEQHTINLTKQVALNKLDPLIGRKTEIDRLFQILTRRTKNNPLIIGDPGVGKTAVVEGLVKKIFLGQCPKTLIGKTIISLDISSLIAGTIYRGQFESRIKKLLSEIKKSGNYILFIDEIHATIGSGSAEGSLDIANILKPVLSRGDIQIIGATTFDEYKKHIEKDSAYERRFQLLRLSEPSKEETVKILGGLKKRYEDHHGIKFSADAISSAVELSAKYISDRYLPDKAIDLLDEAAASTNSVTKETISLAKLKSKLETILSKKDLAISDENYELATELREKEIIFLEKIAVAEKKINAEKKVIVSANDIAKIVSGQTGIEIENLTVNDRVKYLNLESKISNYVIGQEEPISAISKSIRRNRAGISDPNKPVGSFLFLGPTGVGKTYLAKIIAQIIYGSEKSLIKIDMSEFMERHNVSRLIGSPSGYIGYEEGGKLTEAIRHKPNSVILFDEIEKAHPDVFNILLQILEDGYLTDAKGRKVNFRNTIIILTSNLGAKEASQLSIGFESLVNNKSDREHNYQAFKDKVHEELSDEITAELLNRFDQIIVFRSLDKGSIAKIVDLQLSEITNRLKQQNITLSVNKKVKEYLAEIGYSEEYGARQIKRTIVDKIQDPISEAIIAEKFKPNDDIKISINKDKIVLK